MNPMMYKKGGQNERKQRREGKKRREAEKKWN